MMLGTMAGNANVRLYIGIDKYVNTEGRADGCSERIRAGKLLISRKISPAGGRSSRRRVRPIAQTLPWPRSTT
jgi:hypothetical protein